MTIKRIYLDMDGVLCDFERKYTEVFGEPSMYGTDHPPSFHKNWEKFVQNDLFSFLEYFPGAENLLKFINSECVWERYIQVMILSSSGGHGYETKITKQKEQWLIGKEIYYNPIVVPGRRYKCLYANKHSVLIDDVEKNITQFKEKGGHGIVHTSAEDTINQLENMMYDS